LFVARKWTCWRRKFFCVVFCGESPAVSPAVSIPNVLHVRERERERDIHTARVAVVLCFVLILTHVLPPTTTKFIRL